MCPIFTFMESSIRSRLTTLEMSLKQERDTMRQCLHYLLMTRLSYLVWVTLWITIVLILLSFSLSSFQAVLILIVAWWMFDGLISGIIMFKHLCPLLLFYSSRSNRTILFFNFFCSIYWIMIQCNCLSIPCVDSSCWECSQWNGSSD